MRLLQSLLAAILLFIVSCEAEFLYSNLTSCSYQCMAQALPLGNCTWSDESCICLHMDIARATTACLATHCTMDEYLASARTYATSCDLPQDDIGNYIRIPTLIFAAIATVCVTLRFITKLFILRTGFQLDDYFLVVCYLINFLFVHWTISMLSKGYGKHVYQLENGTIRIIQRKLWLSILAYVINLGLVKITILIFYLRLFPYERFRTCTWALMAFVCLTTTMMIFLSIFQCTPIAYYWDKDIKGHCMSHQGVVYSASSLVILSDLLLVVLPIPLINKLKLGLKRKIGVILMFALGSLGCIASIVRLHALAHYGSTLDPTYDLVGASAWSAIEVQIPIATICFPTLRQLYNHYFPPSSSKSKTQPVIVSPSDELDTRFDPVKDAESWITASMLSKSMVEENLKTKARSLSVDKVVFNDVGGILSRIEGGADEVVARREGHGGVGVGADVGR